MEVALQHIQNLVSEAKLSPEVKQQTLWALNHLPSLYADFARTYDVRYRDAINRHVQGILNTLAADPTKCPDAKRVLEGLVSQIQAMHTRLAIPSLGLKIPISKACRKPKSVAVVV